MPHLVVMTGLPGAGKSTAAYGVARARGWPVFSVDPIDSAMRSDGVDADTAGQAAYSVALVLAGEQLALGLSVVIDACNAHADARTAWMALASETGAQLVVIEATCETGLHRTRIEARVRGLAHFEEVPWSRVEAARAEYQPWAIPHLVLDTGALDAVALVRRALAYIDGGGPPQAGWVSNPRPLD